MFYFQLYLAFGGPCGVPFGPGMLFWGTFCALFVGLGAEGYQQQLKNANQPAGA